MAPEATVRRAARASCPTGAFVLPNGTTIANIQQIGGISHNGGSGAVVDNHPCRRRLGRKLDGLKPETATNWGIGFDFTPTGNFLTGLNIQATYYVIKMSAVLQGFGNPSTNSFNDANLGAFAFLVPTDFANNPNLEGYAACTSNLLPTTCAPFQAAVQGLLDNPRNTVDPQAKTLIFWINDGGTFNKGTIKIDGIDFPASYDWDWGDIGAFNIGITGTYYLHRWEQPTDTSTREDMFHTTLLGGSVNESIGVESLPRFRYRARAGWSNGPWSLTGFMNVQTHFFHTQNAPPNVNGNFCASNGSLDAVRQRRHLHLRHQRLHQHPSVLLHVRPVPRLQHDGRTGERVPAQHRHPARGAEHHGSEGRLTATGSAPAAATRVPAIS